MNEIPGTDPVLTVKITIFYHGETLKITLQGAVAVVQTTVNDYVNYYAGKFTIIIETIL